MQILRYVALSVFLLSAGVGHAGVPTNPIQGWLNFCQSEPQECVTDLNEDPVIHVSLKVWTEIRKVNRYVNRSIIAKPDDSGFDEWRIPQAGETGDCEDFQLLKRRLLTEWGLPHRAMRMAVVLDENGEGHAVLIIVTDRGNFVLDNKTNRIREVIEIKDYTFVKMESINGGWETM